MSGYPNGELAHLLSQAQKGDGDAYQIFLEGVIATLNKIWLERDSHYSIQDIE